MIGSLNLELETNWTELRKKELYRSMKPVDRIYVSDFQIQNTFQLHNTNLSKNLTSKESYPFYHYDYKNSLYIYKFYF